MKDKKRITTEELTEEVINEELEELINEELEEADEAFDDLIEEAENPVHYGTVTATKLNIRALASASSSVLGVLDKDEVVVIEGDEKEFYKIITTNGISGYCMKKFISC